MCASAVNLLRIYTPEHLQTLNCQDNQLLEKSASLKYDILHHCQPGDTNKVTETDGKVRVSALLIRPYSFFLAVVQDVTESSYKGRSQHSLT